MLFRSVGMLGFEKKIAQAEEKYYDKLQSGRLLDAVRSGKDGGLDTQHKKNTKKNRLIPQTSLHKK